MLRRLYSGGHTHTAKGVCVGGGGGGEGEALKGGHIGE